MADEHKETLRELRANFVRQYAKEHPNLTLFQQRDRALRAFASAKHKKQIPKRLQPQWEKQFGVHTIHKITYRALKRERGTAVAKREIKKVDKLIRDYKREYRKLKKDPGAYEAITGVDNPQELRDNYWMSYYEWFEEVFGTSRDDYPLNSP